VEAPIEYKTIKEFLNDVKQETDLLKWYYFDYKHMNQWFKEKPEILQSFNWQQFNIELDGTDSTIWIGSKGAHTNCHQDTYGCNLIAQIHGRYV
jgi:HSPB1-associated protein 1